MSSELQNNAVIVLTTATLLRDGNPNRALLAFTNNGER